jgi:hypothetical protein
MPAAPLHMSVTLDFITEIVEEWLVLLIFDFSLYMQLHSTIIQLIVEI